MVYIRKNRKKRAFRAFILFFALAFLLFAAVRAVNTRIDAFIIPLARTGLTGEITKIINEAVPECLGGFSDLVETVYDSGGRLRTMRVDSRGVNLFRAEVSHLVAEKLAALEKIYVDADLSNVFDDEIMASKLNFAFTVDIIFVGGVETDVESEFVSAGINQTNYRMNLMIKASVTADVVSAFTVDVCTSVNIVDMLIVGDVPTVVWG
ncbi:MAG: hypothetical protein IJW21_01835 [Clostridia bacterium]|nr:hypothetical protein [Clostridia bacterium]